MHVAINTIWNPREGTILEPKKRIVKCHGITLKAFNPPFYTLSVRCGGGFYVRSLIHDIGKGESFRLRQVLFY